MAKNKIPPYVKAQSISKDKNQNNSASRRNARLSVTVDPVMTSAGAKTPGRGSNKPRTNRSNSYNTKTANTSALKVRSTRAAISTRRTAASACISRFGATTRTSQAFYRNFLTEHLRPRLRIFRKELLLSRKYKLAYQHPAASLPVTNFTLARLHTTRKRRHHLVGVKKQTISARGQNAVRARAQRLLSWQAATSRWVSAQSLNGNYRRALLRKRAIPRRCKAKTYFRYRLRILYKGKRKVRAKRRSRFVVRRHAAKVYAARALVYNTARLGRKEQRTLASHRSIRAQAFNRVATTRSRRGLLLGRRSATRLYQQQLLLLHGRARAKLPRNPVSFRYSHRKRFINMSSARRLRLDVLFARARTSTNALSYRVGTTEHSNTLMLAALSRCKNRLQARRTALLDAYSTARELSVLKAEALTKVLFNTEESLSNEAFEKLARKYVEKQERAVRRLATKVQGAKEEKSNYRRGSLSRRASFKAQAALGTAMLVKSNHLRAGTAKLKKVIKQMSALRAVRTPPTTAPSFELPALQLLTALRQEKHDPVRARIFRSKSLFSPASGLRSEGGKTAAIYAPNLRVGTRARTLRLRSSMFSFKFRQPLVQGATYNFLRSQRSIAAVYRQQQKTTPSTNLVVASTHHRLANSNSYTRNSGYTFANWTASLASVSSPANSQKAPLLAVNSGGDRPFLPRTSALGKPRILRTDSDVRSLRSFLQQPAPSALAFGAKSSARSAVRNLTFRSIRKMLGRHLRTHRRPRLPGSTVVRRRRTVSKHFLLPPKTLSGLRNQLLPPKVSWSPTTSALSAHRTLMQTSYRVPRQYKSKHPRFFSKKPRGLQRLLILKVTERHRELLAKKKVKRLQLLVRARNQARAKRHDISTVRAIFARERTTPASIELAQVLSNPENVPHNLVSLYSKQLATAGVLPEFDPLLLKSLQYQQTRKSTISERNFVLSHARAVRAAQNSERNSTPYAPSFPNKWRRWGSPRIEGRPLPRYWPSHRVLRQRAAANDNLSFRGLPVRRYIDFGVKRLKFHLGSHHGVGYERYRRTYRVASKNNRWWKPVTYPVPFAHPLSRRSANAAKFVEKKLSVASRTHTLSPSLDLKGFKTEYYPIKHPPRLIPWRNYKYPQPNRGDAPALIQRWSNHARPVFYRPAKLAKHRRAIRTSRMATRTLENLFPKLNVWKGRRWESLDPATAPAPDSRHLFNLFLSIPSQRWKALRESAGNLKSFRATRMEAFRQFASWGKKHLVATGEGLLLSPAQRTAASSFLTLTLDSLISNPLASTQASARQRLVISNRFLVDGGFSSDIAKKRARFWAHRELPELRAELKTDNIDPLDRVNSTLYKRWLHGAERSIMRNQNGYLPPTHNRYDHSHLLTIGRRRTRFPASGRRRKSYDSLLHAFTRRTRPAQFRRVGVTSFVQPRPIATGDFKTNLVLSELGNTTRRRRVLSRKLGGVSYLSPAWRELLAFRAGAPTPIVADARVSSQQGQPFGSAVKRRFASLPTNISFVRGQREQRALQGTMSIQNRKLRTFLLRAALRRRRKERIFVDLRGSTTGRRLPRELLLPPWVSKRLRRSRNKYSRSGNWGARAVYRREEKQIAWTIFQLSCIGTKRADLALTVPTSTYYGEGIVLPTKLTKPKWSRKGFGIHFREKQALLRRNFDSANGSRRKLRGRRIGRKHNIRMFFNHWSERKQQVAVRALNTWPSRVMAAAGEKRYRGFLPFQGYNVPKSTDSSDARMGRWNRQLLAREAHNSQLAHLFATCNTATPQPTAYFSAADLTKFTSMRRVKSLNRLARLAQKQASRRGRRLGLMRVYAHKRNAARAVRAATPRGPTPRPAGSYLGTHLVAQVNSLPVVAPLTFQHLTRTAVKSAGAKRKERAASIAYRELRYKSTAQYITGITTFIPALISQMLTKRVQNGLLSYLKAKQLIHATYWNLRVYLNVDPLEACLTLRDNNYAIIRDVKEDMSIFSKEHVTDQPQRAALRYRFQPGRLLPAPHTRRFRADWLRSFFPKKHALFQEDPDDYGEFIIPAVNIRRLAPNAAGITKWATYPARVNLETRARQILTLKFSRPRQRFETALQGTRRIPAAELTPLAMNAGNSGLFFKSFSTYAYRQTALLMRQLDQRRRLASAQLSAPSVFEALSARYRAKGRLEHRGRSSYAEFPEALVVGGSLDPRFVRAKSARNRQYFARSPSVITDTSIEAKRVRLSNFHQAVTPTLSTQPTPNWTPLQRRFFFNSLQPAHPRNVLSDLRSLFNRRRVLTQLLARRKVATKKIKSALYFNFPNRHQFKYQSKSQQKAYAQLTFKKHYAAMRSTMSPTFAGYPQAGPGTVVTIKTGRSILQYRKAAQRLLKFNYKADRVLQPRPFRLTPQAIKARIKFSAPRRRWNALKRKLGTVLPSLTASTNSKLTGRISRSLQERDAGLVLSKTRCGLGTKRLSQIRSGFTSPFAAGLQRQHLQHVSQKTTSAPRHFRKFGGVQLALKFRAARYALKKERNTLLMTFDSNRRKMWDSLTLRWMKRERLLRTWLKTTKRWLKDPWVSAIVGCDFSPEDARMPGEDMGREQQVGEYVAEVDAEGKDILEEDAVFREREPQTVPSPAPVISFIVEDNSPASVLALERSVISREAQTKPIPSMWLADHEFQHELRLVAEYQGKSVQQRQDEARTEAAEARALRYAGEPPIRPIRPPLKQPSDAWMPLSIWKEIQRRARRLEWRESDELFFRKGFRTAFSFYPSERNRAPWLEALMYNRSLFSTRLREFRRRQFPREQKKYKWLQRVRKSLFSAPVSRYVKGRQWPRLRTYNQKLHYSLFNLPDRSAARRHFQKLNRRRSRSTGGFARSQKGLGDRLDVVLMHLNIAPTIFWARTVAPHGLLRVNGRIIKVASQRLSPGDFIELVWPKILRFRHFFEPVIRRREERLLPNRFSSGAYPTNFVYHGGTRSLVYTGCPKEADLRRSNRLQGRLFRWFKLDSV